MASPHPGMHVLCPACEGPIPDLLGELTDDPVGFPYSMLESTP
jgi:hypothetical protein